MRHVWKTYEGLPPSPDPDDDIDIFGYERGRIHNGPVCINCGFGFCHHCDPEKYDDESCPGPAREN